MTKSKPSSVQESQKLFKNTVT